MSNTTDLEQIIQLGKVASELLNGKEFFVGTLASRLSKAAEAYPHDQAILFLQSAMEKRFAKEGSLATISQKEFSDMYSEVGGLGNNEAFKEQLGDLIFGESVGPVAHYNENYVASIRDSGDELALADQQAVSEYKTLFGEPDGKLRASAMVEGGKQGIKLELMSFGFDSPSVEVAAQSDSHVVFSAEVDTVFGRTPFLIPAEVKLGSVLMPSLFVSGGSLKEITKDNIERYSQSISEGAKVPTPNAILSALERNKVVNKVASGVSDYIPEGAGLFMEIDDSPVADPGLEFHIQEVPSELQGITEAGVKETLIEAGLSFDRDTVITAKSTVSTELNSMGIRHGKMKVASEFAGGFVLSTVVSGKGGNKTIEVPVEVSNGQVLMPSMFSSGSVVKAFDESSLKEFVSEGGEGTFNSMFSDKGLMSYSELYNSAMKSAAYGDFVNVEECLAVIGDRFGPSYHKTAFNDLMELVRIGFNSDAEKPMDAVESYIKEAAKLIPDKEENIKMSSTLMYLYPKDEQ